MATKCEHMTKKQLMLELAEVRQRIAKLDASEAQRRQMEQALRDSEEHWRSLVETASDAMISTDDRGNIVLWNRAAETMFGWSACEAVGKSLKRIIPQRLWTAFLESLKRVVYTEESNKVDRVGRTIEMVALRRDGCEFPVELTLATWNTRGSLFFTGVVRDVTERKRDQERTRELTSAVEQSTDGILMGDLGGPETRITYVNQAFARMHGYSPQEMIGMKIADLTDEEEWAEHQWYIEHLRSHGSWGGEIEHIRRDGTLFPTYVSVTMLKDTRGEPVGTLAITRDITERKRAEEALRDSERRFRDLIESLPDPVYETTLDRICSYANEAYLRMVGYSRSEIEDNFDLIQLLPPEERQHLGQVKDILMAGQRPPIQERNFVKKDGTPFIGRVHVVPILEDGSVVGARGVVRDITEHRRDQEALRESEERFRAQYKGIPIPVYTWQRLGEDFVLIDCNDAANATTHGRIASLLGTKADEFFRDAPEVVNDIRRCFTEKTSIRREGPYRSRSTGEINYLATTFAFVPPDLVLAHTEDITERKRAEEAMRNSEERFRELAQLLPDTVFEFDANRNLTFINDAGMRMFGYSKEEMASGFSARQWVAPEEREDSARAADLVLDGATHVVERTFIRKDGSRFVGEIHDAPVYESGKIVGVRGVIRDITHRTQAEELFRTLANSSPIGIFVVQDGKFVFVNPKFQEYTGYSEDELLGRDSLQMLVHPDDREMVRNNAVQMLKGERSSFYEYRVITKSGETRWIMETVASIQYQGERAAAGNYIDITESKRAEEALRDSEERFRELAQLLPDTVFEFDANRNLTFINDAGMRMFGYSKEEMASGFSARQWVAPEEREDSARAADLVLDGATHVVERTFIRKDGARFVGEIHDAPIYESGEIVGTRCVIRDITHRKQMDKQLQEYSENLKHMVAERTRELEQAQETLVRSERLAAIGELAGGVGHDLRNPLAAIRTSAYYLKMRLGGADEKVDKHLDMLESRVDACNRIITNLLDFSRLSHATMAGVNVIWVIQDVLSATAVPPSVEVVVLGEGEGLATLNADATQLERAFSNLIANALEAMPGGGRLTIAVDQKGCFIEVRVTDTGVGIAEENLDDIFKPLFTTKPKGTGLGLSVVQAMMERIGGSIEVESEVGKGTTFLIRLPFAGTEGRKAL